MNRFKKNNDRTDSVGKIEPVRQDSVTGLAAHTDFQQSVTRELSRFERTGSPFTLAFMDIDHFRDYNQRHGYVAGDRLLRQIGELINHSIRHHDLVARYGPDTFAILFCGSDAAAAHQGVKRIQEAVRAAFDGNGSLSTGLAACPADAVERQTLLARAEEALCEAKKRGGNQIVCWQTPPPVPVATKGRILVIDDMTLNLKMMRRLLISQDYEVVTMKSGIEAPGIVAESDIDLVLLDVMMPEIDGFEVCRRLKSNDVTRLVPVVLVTTLDDPKSMVKGIEAGADDFLTKPPDKVRLLARTRSLIRMRRANRKLANIESVLFSLAKAIEAKDPYTEGHVERVSSLALSLGRWLKLPDNEIEALRIGGILHDIGKIGIPNRILNKPGPLNDAEWRIMRTHPDIGHRICLPLSQSLGMSLEVIRHHHEKLDGSGYPDGLQGDRIPAVARIMAVVDIYDALVSDRPYRKGMARQQALSILKKEAQDGKLDAAMVTMLIARTTSPSLSTKTSKSSSGPAG